MSRLHVSPSRPILAVAVACLWATHAEALPAPGASTEASLLVRPFPDLFLPPLRDEARTGTHVAELDDDVRDAGGATVGSASVRGEIAPGLSFRPDAAIDGDFAGLAVNADASSRLVSRWRFTHPTLPDGSVAPYTFAFEASGTLFFDPADTDPATGFAGVDLTVGLFTDFAGPVPAEVVTGGFVQTSASYQLLEDTGTPDPDDALVFEDGFSGVVALTDGGSGSFIPLVSDATDVLVRGEKVGFDTMLRWSGTFSGIVGAEYAIEFGLDSFVAATDGGASVRSDFASTGTFSIENEFGESFTPLSVPEPAAASLLAVAAWVGRRRRR